MYRVYQQYDVTLKQDLQRTSHAAMRNAFFQRSMKPTYKSAARINKETITKSRRVIKEVSCHLLIFLVTADVFDVDAPVLA